MSNPFSLGSEMGIRKRVFFLLVVIFVPLLFLHGLTFYRWYRESKKAEIQANLELARTVSKTFDSFINDVLHTQLAIGLAATASPLPSSDSLRRILQGAEETSPMLRSFTWSSPAGASIVTTNTAVENPKIRAQALVPRIVSGEEYCVSDLHYSPNTGEKVFVIGRGILDPRGNLLGIVSCVCIADKLDPLLAVQRSTDTAISLLDSKGSHVYRYPDFNYTPEGTNRLERQPLIQNALEGKEAAVEVCGPREERRLAAFVPIPSIGWVAASSRAKHEVTAGITQTVLPQALFMALVTLAAFGAAVILSRPISTSIRRLQDRAAVLGQGDLEKFEMVLGPREIKSLSETLNEMAEKVRSRERALRKSEQKFRVLFENSPDGVFLTSPDGSIEAANPAAIAMLGYSEEEICRLGRSGLLDQDDPRLSARLEERQGTGRVQAQELTAIRKSGERFPVEVDSVILPTEPRRAFVIMRDVTERKRAEEALRESEERFRLFMNNSPTIAWIKDEQGRHVYLSKTFDDRFGVKFEDWHGKTDTELRPEAAWDLFRKNDLAVLSADHAIQVIEETVNPDGSRCFWLSCKFPFRDSAGNRFVGGIGLDITEQKRMEEGLRELSQRLTYHVENSPLAVIEWGADMRLTRWSGTAERVFGWRAEEVIGKRIEEFLWIYEEDEAQVAEISARLKNGMSRQSFSANRNYRKDGSVIHCEWYNSRLVDDSGKLRSILSLVLDVTERKRLEEELRKSRDELEFRVEERTSELERRNQDLQELTVVASHDLSEPLRKIQTFASLLETRKADLLDERSRDFVARMKRSADRMRDLLDALLRYLRIETKVDSFRLTRLGDVVLEVVGQLEPEIRETGSEVEIGPLPIVVGDPNQLRELIRNLIANALKYHRSEVKTIIKIRGEKIGDAFSISVEDNGIGFDEKYLDKIFQPFQRLHRKHEYSGTGIGLAICKKIVDRHGGTITARSSPGKRSAFIFTLPVERRRE
ncbi:MAG: PAS domain S-box protein [Desulfobacterales bacterium]|nr:PAS domain S-box protein [Desulfobacterales bacterium]